MTAYFYFGGTENNSSYYHDYSCIAEGLKELGVECYGNMNMCQIDLDGHYLINYDKQFDEKDADIDKILNWFCWSKIVLRHTEQDIKVKKSAHSALVMIFNVRHPERDRLKEYLLKNGIKTDIHYPIPPHHQKAMRGILQGEYPVSEEVHRTTLSLPISFGHTKDEVCTIIEVMNKF
jgi:dTDP-4-amino-4,6-dideoxygalactose transaminase